MRPLRRALAPFALVLALAACAAPGAPAAEGPSSPPATAPVPTVAPTDPPATVTTVPAAPPTVAPATPTAEAPTAAPAAGLPGPIYAISAESSQVVRIEADGATVTQITFEELPVRWLAVATGSGTIAYVTAGEAGVGRLYALDGSGRRQLMEGAITWPALSPDGQTVLYRLENAPPGLIIGQEESPSGVWASRTAGTRPSLVQADAADDDEFDPDSPAWVYWPLGYAPDGSRFALYAFDGDGPGIPGGQLTILDPSGQAAPVVSRSCCEEERWSLDSASLLVAGGGPGPDLRYGLFRVDAATGAEQEILGADDEAEVPLVTAPQQLADGQIYAFVELLPWDELSWERPFRPALSRVAEDGTVTPLREPITGPLEVLWDRQAAGALIAPFADVARGDAEGQLVWLPAGPGEPLRLAARGSSPRWAAEEPLSAGDCAAFAPIGFEPEATRVVREEARDVQLRLAALGLDPGPADGLYGEQTQGAVSAFQAERGLPASGDVDCATWQAMLAPER